MNKPNPIDPLVGWYDKMVKEGDEQKLKLLRSIPIIVAIELEEDIDVDKFKEHCIEFGYGTRETMDILFPKLDTPE